MMDRWIGRINIALFCLFLMLLPSTAAKAYQQISTSGSPGGITNSAGNNVLIKSNGTNGVASSFTDDGTTSATTNATFNVSAAGTGNGVLGLKGNTSGTATITAPAVAGTTTNAVVSSNVLQGPVGSTSAASFQVGEAGSGIYRSAVSRLGLMAGSAEVAVVDGGTGFIGSRFGYCQGASNAGATECMTHSASGVASFGTTTPGDSSAKLKFAAMISGGATFTTNSGCTEDTLVGGASAGKFTSRTTGACTVIVTLGNSATSTTGWFCGVSDQTTGNLWRETASTTTTVSFSGTSVGGDIISFGGCQGF